MNAIWAKEKKEIRAYLVMILQYTLSKDTLRLKFEASRSYLKLNQINLILIKKETIYYARVLIKSWIKETLP